MRRRGFTLLEVLVAASVLALLITAVLAVYLWGLRAWAQGDARLELLQDNQVALRRLAREIQESAYGGLTVDPAGSALALLLPYDEEGACEFDPDSGGFEWKTYVVYYRDQDQLMRRMVPLVAGAPQRKTPGPIEGYDPGGGSVPLSDYQVGGEAVCRKVVGFALARDGSPRLVRLELATQKRRYGQETPERVTLRTAARTRN